MNDAPKFTRPFSCASCGNTAPMRIVAEYRRSQVAKAEDLTRRAKEEEDNSQELYDEGPLWELVECPGCEDVLLRKGHWHEWVPDEYTSERELLYPPQSDQIEGLPDSIAKAYAAALRVKPIDSNAFAVLLGRVLDFICIDKNATGDSLSRRLQDIAEKGIIPRQLADMAHALRHLRNIGAHAELGELTLAEVPVLHALCRAILEYVYSAPALVDQVQKRINNLKLKHD
jgi:Domain of unknown function (DUF4145)